MERHWSFLLGACAVAASFLVLRRLRHGRWLVLEPCDVPPVRWNLLDVSMVVLLFLVLSTGFNIVLSLKLHKEGWDAYLVMFLMRAAQVVVDVVTLFYVFQVVFRSKGHTIAEVGLSLPEGAWHAVKTGLGAYLTALPFIFLVSQVSVAVLRSEVVKGLMDVPVIRHFLQSFNVSTGVQESVKVLVSPPSTGMFLMTVVLVSVVAPPVEEIFFRGFLQRAIRNHYGEWSTYLLTALVFAGVHLNLRVFAPLFCLGLVLSYLAGRTRSLVPSMVAHSAHNTLMVVMAWSMRCTGGG